MAEAKLGGSGKRAQVGSTVYVLNALGHGSRPARVRKSDEIVF